MSPPFHFRLLDLLRCRRELPPEEVCCLLDPLPALFDASPTLSGPLLTFVAVRLSAIPAGKKAEDYLGMDVTKWPRFELSLLSKEADDSEPNTMSDTTLGHSANTTARFAALVYELLGGSRRDEWGAVQFSPLPNLGESANELLREGFADRSVHACRSFWQRWKRETGDNEAQATLPELPKIPAVAEWRIPPLQLGNAQHGDVLNFIPQNEGVPPIRLSSKGQFRVGRSRDLSDFPVRYSPSPNPGENVRELSRVHVLMERCPTGLTLRDGNGDRKSTNGSIYGTQPLDPKRPHFLHGRDLLILSDDYRLDVTPAFRRDPIMPEPVNFWQWKGAAKGFDARSPISGAVFFAPLDGHPVIRDAVWLLSEVGFYISDEGKIIWTDLEESAAGWFLHRSGAFWLANATLPTGTITVDDGPLSAGEVIPLIAGQKFTVMETTYETAIV